MSWKKIKLGEYFNITSSKRVFQSEWTENGVPFYRAREVVKLAKDGFVNNELFISEEMYAEYSEKYGVPSAGDFLVTGVGTLGKVYVVKENDRFYFKDGNIIWMKKKKEIHSKFIEYVFKTKDVQRYIQNSPGATVGTYTIIKAKETVVPLPPIAEQKKIAEILDTADSLRQKDQQLIEHYTALSQSLFLEMFGDPITNPMEWDYVPLTNLVTKLGDGLHGTPIYSEDGEYYFVNGNNLNHGVIEYTSRTKKVAKNEYVKHKKELNSTTMLVSINGTIGKVAFYNGEKIILGKSACYFNINELLINKLYLFRLVESPYFIRYALGKSTGSTIKNVSLKTMREFPVLMPPLVIQNQFAERIEVIEKQKKQAQINLEKSEALFNSLLQRAFKGELTGSKAA